MALVLLEKKDAVGVLTLNRPEVKNALNMALFEELNRALDAIKEDQEVKAFVVTGAGDSFVSGADVNELLSMDLKQGFEASRFQQSVFDKLEKLGKPSVAAIKGYCLGGGLELALSCTFRIAARDARLGFPELRFGIIPAFGGTERLIRTVGFPKALEVLLFQRILTGEEAERIGLVNLSCAPEELEDVAMKWALDLTKVNPFCMKLALELFYRGVSKGMEEDLAFESALAALLVATEEAKELLRAFVQKRR